jgi:ABC-2 type transport system permease protein
MRPANVLHLGIKELWSLARDPSMLLLIVFVFTVSVYTGATVLPETLHLAPIAIVDEDRSPLSERIIVAFEAPYFQAPRLIDQARMDERMDAGLDTFALVIPTGFQRDVLAGRSPAVQLNVDATRVSQALTGSGYVQAIIGTEVQTFVRHTQATPLPTVDLVVRMRFNPELTKTWFGAVNKVIDNITLLSIVLTGAALIRERERGTIEHLLVMPVTPFEIMASKVWSMGLVVLAAGLLSLEVVVKGVLAVPLAGSLPLFAAGTALYLFAATSLGIFLGTFARSMAQFGLLLMMVLLPLQMLSGGVTPRESMPELVRNVMLAAPNTHFVMLAQGILFRGATLSVVWPQLLALVLIGSVFFAAAHARFRSAITAMA